MKRNILFLSLISLTFAGQAATDPNKDLLNAIRSRNIAKATTALQNEANPNYMHCIPLRVAAMFGDIKSVDLLLSYGANIDAQDSEGRTALSYAAEYGSIDIVAHLLKHGANPNITIGGGYLPLHFAARAGRAKVALLLLQHGANPDSRSFLQDTPLSLAALGGSAQVISHLLTHGANPNVKYSPGTTPLHLVCQHRDSYSQFALRVVNPEVSWISVGVWEERHEAAVLLLEHGAHPNEQDKWGQTAFHILLESGRPTPEVVKHFIDHGADPTIENKFGKTALQIAQRIHIPAIEGYHDIVSMLESASKSYKATK